ncbi:hypothetical protein AQUCO_00700501v1 [Aquilegia coerulea]|uniref:Uncharacterized protein n=1 Tax=Aquilegia coerulea TaxID=218851 RepID=A0A2G5EK94_AQUCA|nr:hypothetical protein AQUCO_00700501v1 [Aquilegia coerulea]
MLKPKVNIRTSTLRSLCNIGRLLYLDLSNCIVLTCSSSGWFVVMFLWDIASSFMSILFFVYFFVYE